MKSVFQKNKQCYFCGRLSDLHSHHIFGGTANRKVSEQYGFKVWLCAPHHNMSSEGIHFNKESDLLLKKIAQKYYEKNIGSRENFIRDFGKSWL